jgi:anti-anti-sigma factor
MCDCHQAEPPQSGNRSITVWSRITGIGIGTGVEAGKLWNGACEFTKDFSLVRHIVRPSTREKYIMIGGVAMSGYCHIELLRDGRVSVMRLLNHGSLYDEEVVAFVAEWNSVVERTDCQTLFVDCSNVPVLSSEMLSKLISLQRRLRQKGGKLVLSGLRPAVRKVLGWTKLDRFFEIDEERPEAAALA